MSKKLKRWRIHVIRKKGEYLGTVEAPDEPSAIKAAIREFEVTDPERQKRLVAQPEE